MMTPELARFKLAAFLHDPPHKPLVLGRGAGHKAYAESVWRALGLDDLLADGRGERAKAADHIAAAADRPNFPGHVTASFWRRPALSHPLTKKPSADQPSVFELHGLPGELDAEAVTRGVERAAHILREQAGGDLARLYLLLWRYFPEYLRAGEVAPEAGVPVEQYLGLLWHALPADTRVPDHTIWDHLAVTAAVAGALPRPALLVFALGPVQSFIAQARTTRDLWAGSFLLSHLAWAAMRPLCEGLGPDCLLYPALRGQPPVDHWLREEMHVEPPGPRSIRVDHEHLRLASFPNKFVALVPAERAAELAQSAQEAVQATWQGIAADVRAWLAGRGVAADQQVWQRQIGHRLETFWSVLPWPASSEVEGEQPARTWLSEQLEPWLTPAMLERFWPTFNAYAREGRYDVNAGTLYAPLHGTAQRVFDAAKLGRPFGQVEEPGYKCTLCGEREPVLADDAGYREQRAAWTDAAKRLAGDVRPEGRERLCAVCLTKRLAPEHSRLHEAAGGEPSFPSTSTMAALPVMKWLIEHADVLSRLDDFLAALDLVEEAVRQGAVLDAAIGASPAALSALAVAARRFDGPARNRAERLRRLDGEWLFTETYARHIARVEGGTSVHIALYLARCELAKVWRQAEDVKLLPPKCSPYYAILLMDGDHMGRWVSGAQHKNTLRDLLHPDVLAQLKRDGHWNDALGARRLFGPSTHAALSGALLAFSLYTVPWLVEHEGQGRVVYAGGDDVLAFLPLNRVLSVAHELRQAYGKTYALVHDGGQVSFGPPPAAGARTEWRIERHMGSDATASAGIALVHHLYPLGAALEQLRQWERQAKDVHDRDAFVVGVIRRSGPDIVFGGKWPLMAELRAAQQAFACGELPSRTPYLVRELAESGAGSLDIAAREGLLRALLQRREGRDSDAADLPSRLVEVWREKLEGNLARFAELLMLARFLAQEVGDDGTAPDA